MTENKKKLQQQQKFTAGFRTLRKLSASLPRCTLAYRLGVLNSGHAFWVDTLTQIFASQKLLLCSER